MKILLHIMTILICLMGETSLVVAQEGFVPHGSETTGGATWVVALDGSGQFISIQEAIDQAHNGDTIFIKAGNYSEDVTVHSKEGLKIVGEGWKKVLIAGLNRVGTLHIGKWPYGATNVEISGMSIQQHGGLGIGIFNGAGVTLRDIHVNGLIFVQQVQHVRIENCIVGGSETTGMAFADSEATLIGNIIHDNDHGVSIGGTSKVVMKHNVITRSLFEAVLVADKGQASLIQNTLVDNGGGVKFQDESSGAVQGNIIDKAKVGIAFSSKNTVKINHNGLNNNAENYQIDGHRMPPTSNIQSFSDIYVAPEFVAPNRGDFRLKASSPLIRIGKFPYLGALAPIQK